MDSFRAYRVHDVDGKPQGRLEDITLDDLSEGEVVIRAAYSDVNYKDALAATGSAKIMRRLPMVGGIDVSGHVHSSTDARFKEGDAVLVAGANMSEEFDGGYAQYVRVPSEAVVAVPNGLTLYETMAVGTAGFTAALAVEQMERCGQAPELGPILVNGATGGVGSFVIDMLAGRGYDVTAFTGKHDSEAYLRELGATDVKFRDEVEMGSRPLERAVWGGAVDSVGGEQLGWLTRTVVPEGCIAAIGLAGGIKLETTVMPFILRGINLLGINSVTISPEMRARVWERVATDLRPRHFGKIVTREVSLEELPGVFDAYISGDVTGRTVVKIAP
jgi:acrylyl-CoA reductase (NADPH)